MGRRPINKYTAGTSGFRAAQPLSLVTSAQTQSWVAGTLLGPRRWSASDPLRRDAHFRAVGNGEFIWVFFGGGWDVLEIVAMVAQL